MSDKRDFYQKEDLKSGPERRGETQLFFYDVISFFFFYFQPVLFLSTQNANGLFCIFVT